MNLALVDLGYGNLASVVMAFERLGVTPLLTGDPALVARADRVVLPGVGAAGFAMRRIAELGLAESLRARTAPSLGICLGMQLLFERSEEADVSCLGLIEGAVRRLDAAPRRPVPHMGWSRLSDVEAGLGLAEGDYVYFAHGFACDDGPASVAVVQYGRRIAAAARRGAWLGAQFHPERSGGPGARFLEAFLSAMILYPAMDLMGGKCVRLRQGRFDAATSYEADPAAALAGFARDGAVFAHVVDLDGARAGAPRQHELIARLADAAPLRLQVAGGFRQTEHLERMFEAGVARVAVGSLAVTAPDAVRGFLAAFGAERITLALDVDLSGGVPRPAVAGWAHTASATLWDIAALYPDMRHALITDIGRDGMMGGPNLALVGEAVRRLPHVAVQASGGVADLADLADLAEAGAAGTIVGRALWDARFTLAEALAIAGA